MEHHYAFQEREYQGIVRWLRDANNAAGIGHKSYSWDTENKILTVFNTDGSKSTFTGDEIAGSSPDDTRIQHLRINKQNETK